MTTRHRNRLVREARVTGALLEQRKTGLRSALERLKEAGRVLSAANEEKLRAAQDSITAVLASLGIDDAATEAGDANPKCQTCDGSGKVREGAVDCPDCKGSGEATAESKESRRGRLLELAEAYSGAATDAGTGAWIIASVLNLMSEESDEPDQLAVLHGAFAALMTWVSMEVTEIGGPDDDTEDPWAAMWGWESARKRIADSGGPIKPPDGLLTSLREAKKLRTDLVPIAEAAVKEDGTGAIKIIAPGWGSSGYYPAEVLERDGPTVFPAGTKMFWDHPTLTEEWERPERSLRDLAGETTSDARWVASGSEGPGLYAETKVFEGFAPVVNELAPSIGVSIRAYGRASTGEAEGQSGVIIEELVGAESIDFVTFPGAGGQVLQLFEAARPRLGNSKPEEASMEVEKDPKFVEMAAGRKAAEDELVLIQAREVVASKLAEATIPEATSVKLKASLAVDPPVKDGKLDKPALEAKIAEAIVAEKEYVAKLTEAGQIKGMGGAPAGDPDLTKELEASFKRRGLSESAAKVAVSGRK